jgi:exosome complex RNA-binding protein Rrp4
VQVRLVAFDSQDLAGAGFGEVGDMVTLTVQRVDRDHSVAQAADLVEQRRETGYLVGVVLYVSSNARCRSQRAPQPLGSFLCR